jgi:hypothetical protein
MILINITIGFGHHWKKETNFFEEDAGIRETGFFSNTVSLIVMTS